jgi:hypothetical protein
MYENMYNHLMNSKRDQIQVAECMRWLTDPPDSEQTGMINMISLPTEE